MFPTTIFLLLQVTGQRGPRGRAWCSSSPSRRWSGGCPAPPHHLTLPPPGLHIEMGAEFYQETRNKCDYGANHTTKIFFVIFRIALNWAELSTTIQRKHCINNLTRPFLPAQHWKEANHSVWILESTTEPILEECQASDSDESWMHQGLRQ